MSQTIDVWGAIDLGTVGPNCLHGVIIAENKDDIGAAGCLRNREAIEHHPAEQGHPGRGSRSGHGWDRGSIRFHGPFHIGRFKILDSFVKIPLVFEETIELMRLIESPDDSCYAYLSQCLLTCSRGKGVALVSR